MCPQVKTKGDITLPDHEILRPEWAIRSSIEHYASTVNCE